MVLFSTFSLRQRTFSVALLLILSLCITLFFPGGWADRSSAELALQRQEVFEDKTNAMQSYGQKWLQLKAAMEAPSFSAEELQTVRAELLTEFEAIQNSMNEDLDALESDLSSPLIMERYRQFFSHYQNHVQGLLDLLQATSNAPTPDQLFLLRQKVGDIFGADEVHAPKNSTPFRLTQDQMVREQRWTSAFSRVKHLQLLEQAPSESEIVAPLERSETSPERRVAASRSTRDASYPDALETLASELDYAPLAIYNYVYNNISYTPYYGVKKGAYNTYLEKTGNDADISLLLQDLLEISGYSVQLTRGEILLEPEQVQAWLGMDDTRAAAQHLANSKIPLALYVDEADEPVYVFLEHTWVEVELPYEDYRGTGDSSSDMEWVPLDASLKEIGASQGLNAPDAMGFSTEDFFEDYLSGSLTGTPIEALQTQVESFLAGSYPNLSYENVQTELHFTPQTFEFLPNTLPYSVVNELSSDIDLSEALKHQIRYEVTDDSGVALLSTVVDVQDLADKQVVLGFEAASAEDQAVIDYYGSIYLTPPYLIEVKPVLRVNGATIASGSAVGGAMDLALQMEFLMPHREITEGEASPIVEETVDMDFNAGNDVAIAMNTDRLVPPEFFPDSVETSEFLNDQKLYKTAWEYLSRVAENQEQIGELFGGSYTNTATRAFVFNGVDITTVSGVPQTFEWRGLRLDSSAVINYFPYFGEWGTHFEDFNLIFGLSSSLDESSIFEDNYDVEAMSTVKGIKLINSGSIPGVHMVKLTSANASDLNTLSLSSSTKATLQAEINNGHTVYTPNQAFSYLDWTGLVYITLDSEDGDGGYIIGEGLNGGYTIQEMDTWQSFFYYYYDNLSATITSPSNYGTYSQGSCVSYSITYSGTYDWLFSTLPVSWTETGCIDTTHLEGTYYISSGYGTNEIVYFIVESGTFFIDTSLMFPKCDYNLDQPSASFDYPCEEGRRMKNGDSNTYYSIDMIVLHYTAGSSVTDAVYGWLNDKESSAHYVVDRDGSIYQIIDDSDKAWHVVRDSQAVNARSIGIEIVNEGYDRFTVWGEGFVDYVWNGHSQWQPYPEIQCEAVKDLVQYLSALHGIPEVIFRGDVLHGPIDYIDTALGDEEAADAYVLDFQGVVGHSALQSNKSDPGPLFDFDNLFSE